uniref:Uncharacterized protein n=1 Tax=Pelodiscus sinensis TaxID=13735 RepID=K7G1M9_PELSI
FMVPYKGSFDDWISLRRELDQARKWTNGTEFKRFIMFPIVGEAQCAFLSHNSVVASSGCSNCQPWICSKPA